MKEIKVSTESFGLRLDVFLHGQFFDFSRGWIQKLIKKGNAEVNGKIQDSKYKIKTGDFIKFNLETPPEISLEGESGFDSKIKIVFENDDFLVIDKPAGISAHPSSSEPKGTIVNWALWKYPAIRSVRDSNDNLRPGIVHRLDKDTSGLMLIAKNQRMFNWLKKQFQAHLVIKKYIALANGTVKNDEGKIDLNITRSKKDPTQNNVTKSKTIGRSALTFWKVLKRYAGYTLLEVTPQTGRMHQIRVHLKSMGTPVAGDKKYFSKNLKSPKHLGRMFLHAAYLSFNAQSGEKFSFHSPLPAELESALQNLPFMIR